jgi:hypothetical protein
LLLSLAASVSVAAPARAGEPLRWKFKPGETLRYTLVQETVQRVKAMGQPEAKSTLNQTVNMHWEVKRVSSDGVAEMSQTIDHVRMKVDSPLNSFEFDSSTGKVPEGPIAGPLVPLLRALVGAEFTLKMSARGELSEVKVPQKLIDSLRQSNPAAGGGMVSEDGLKNLISQSSLALPEGPLDKGKTWTNQSKLPLPMVGTMVTDKRYTFEGPDPKAAGLLQISLEIKMSLEPAADSNVALKITAHDGKGEFLFDPQAGRIVSSHVDDKMKMSVSVQGQNIEQATDTITKMTLGKEGSAPQ